MRTLLTRRAVTFATALVAAGGVAAVLMACFGAWDFGLVHETRATVVTVVTSAAAFALVVLTVMLALFAYLAASGLPDLKVELRFPFSAVNMPVFRADVVLGPSQMLRARSFKQTRASVTLTNKSKYAARNPGVRVEVDGLHGLQEQAGWRAFNFLQTQGWGSLQWEGGADGLVHGCWSRPLPDLDLDGVGAYRSTSTALCVTVTADGIQPRSVVLPVRLLEDDEYAAWDATRTTEECS